MRHRNLVLHFIWLIVTVPALGALEFSASVCLSSPPMKKPPCDCSKSGSTLEP
jgi:hypothetical protein